MSSQKYDVYEVRRGYLRFSDNIDLDKIIAITKDKPINKDDKSVVLSAIEADRLIEDCRKKGYSCLSIRDRINGLKVPLKEDLPSSPFAEYSLPEDIDNPTKFDWETYSFVSRRLHSVKIRALENNKFGFIAREGQIFRAWYNTFSAGHYVAQNGELIKVLDVQQLLVEAHGKSTPAQMFYEPSAEYFIKMYKTSIWLAPNHYDLLYKCLPAKEISPSDMFILIYKDDLELVRQITKSLFIDLKKGAPPQFSNVQFLKVAERASRLTSEIYSSYLHNQNKFDQFRFILLVKDWIKIENLDLKNELVELSNKAYDGDRKSECLMEFITEKLPTLIDWKELKSTDTLIEGILIDKGGGGDKNSNYYKSIFPKFDLLLGESTTRRLSGRYDRIPWYWISNQWRLIPYCGRFLIPQGPWPEVVTDRPPKELLIENAYKRILGIPSIEGELVSKVYLGSFFLDRDQKMWRGCPEYSRYFRGYGRLIQKHSCDFDKPAALFEDIFGKKFYLLYGEENYLKNKDFISFTGEGFWKRFTAHSGLINQLKAASELPVFSLVADTVPRDSGHEKVIIDSFVALVKYHESLPEKSLDKFVGEIVIGKCNKKEIKDKILSEKNLLKYKGRFYYIPGYCCSPEEFVKIISSKKQELDTLAKKYINFFGRYKSIIHPLKYGISMLDESKVSQLEPRPEWIESAEQHLLVLHSSNIEQYYKDALKNIQQYGVIVLSARGRWIKEQIEVVKKISVEKYPGMTRVLRKDIKSEKGLEVHYRIESPLFIAKRELKKNPYLRIKSADFRFN